MSEPMLQALDVGEHVGLPGDEDELPVGAGDRRPGGKVRLAGEREAHGACLLSGEGFGQRRSIRLVVQLELGRLQDFLRQLSVIALPGREIAQLPVGAAVFADRHHRVSASDEHGIAVPWHRQAEHLFQKGADGDVDARDAFELVTAVDRRDGRCHPAKPGGIEVKIGPDYVAFRIVFRVSFVIKIERRYIHLGRILLIRGKVWKYPVH